MTVIANNTGSIIDESHRGSRVEAEYPGYAILTNRNKCMADPRWKANPCLGGARPGLFHLHCKRCPLAGIEAFQALMNVINGYVWRCNQHRVG